MNKDEARSVLAKHLAYYRGQSYSALLRLLDEQDTCEVLGDSGAVYQVEVFAHWDDKPDGNLRVFGCVDDGGWRASFPLTDDFIVSPLGKLVGEE